MLPEDAQPVYGEFRDFLRQHYQIPEDDVDEIAERYGLLCSPSEQRLLFPFRYEVRAKDRQTYAEEGWPLRTVAVWGRAIGRYSMHEGPDYRYWIRPEDARPLYIPRRVAFDYVFLAEGAMDAIKLQHYLPWVQGCGSWKGKLSNECFSVMQQAFGLDAPIRVIYDAGNYPQASNNAAELRQRGFKDALAIPFPYEDPGACTPDELKQWLSTSF